MKKIQSIKAKKTLVIIAGITGTIGNAFFMKYARNSKYVVYGTSRKGNHYKDFIDPSTKLFYTKSFICSLNQSSLDDCEYFSRHIDYNNFKEIIYIHACGKFLTEMNDNGSCEVVRDYDNDGINDECLSATYINLKNLIQTIIKNSTHSKIKSRVVVFGSLSDKHKLKVHRSWWKSMDKLKTNLRSLSKKYNLNAHVVNISSVLSANELIVRPYVFIKTDANPRYWLQTNQLVNRVVKKMTNLMNGYVEYEVFNKAPKFENNHFKESLYLKRRSLEIFKK